MEFDMKAKYVTERQINDKIIWVFQPPKKWQQALGARFQRFDKELEACSHSNSVSQAYIDFCCSRDGRIFVDEHTVGGMIQYYKTTRHYQERLRDSSKVSYDLAFKKVFEAPPFKGCSQKLCYMQSANVTPDIADNVFQYFSQEVSPAYAITVCRRLRRVWNVGYRKGLVNEGNPFAKMGLSNETVRDVRWSEEQVNKAIETADECNKQSIGTAITLMYHLCHHPVDIRQMRWGDIVDGKIKFTRQKTGAKLDIPLAPPIVERLEKVMPPSARLDDFIIKNEFDGRPYTTSVLQRHFRKVRLHANLPDDLKLGDLRASGAIEMANNGCTNAEMRSVTGHKTLDVLALYARPTDTQAGNAINKRYAKK
jgi:integrase